uniref:Uncharacterized protein n=1 Tax=Anguilla anguilla TaxID=7936 RepID=A0A0E9VAV2_ANGAN
MFYPVEVSLFQGVPRSCKSRAGKDKDEIA